MTTQELALTTEQAALLDHAIRQVRTAQNHLDLVAGTILAQYHIARPNGQIELRAGDPPMLLLSTNGTEP